MRSSCHTRGIPLLTLTIGTSTLTILYLAVAVFFASRLETDLRVRNASKEHVQIVSVSEHSSTQSFPKEPLTSETKGVGELKQRGKGESVNQASSAPRISHRTRVQLAQVSEQPSPHSITLPSKESQASGARAIEEVKEGSKGEAANQVPSAPRVSSGIPKQSGDLDQDLGDILRLYKDDAKYGTTTMCRFSRACVDTNGDLLLPNSFERFRASIAKECRLENSRLAFYDPASDSRTRDPALTRHHHAKHLAGIETLRFHIPHMVTDLLKYTVVLFPYLQQLAITRNTTVSCFEPDDSSFGAREYNCDTSPPQISSVLIEKRARSMGWIPGLFQLLQSPSSAAPLEAMYTDEAFPVEEWNTKMRTNKTSPKNACFASISIRGKALTSLTAHTLHQGLLTQPAIAREIEAIPKHVRCRMNVTIINRPVGRQTKHHLSTESRRVVNADSVRKALLAEAHRLKISISVSERTDFHEISFLDQFKVMQGTHSLISIHGAELGNMMFLRRRSTLVEIFPFRYRAGIFEGLAEYVGLGHEAITAKPDVEGYRKCMLGVILPDSPYRKEAELAVRQFENAASAFLAAKTSEERSSIANHFDAKVTKVGSAARVCARSQRLVISDPEHVAQRALQNFKQQCYGD